MKLEEFTFGTGKQWVKRLLRLVFFIVPTATVLSLMAFLVHLNLERRIYKPIHSPFNDMEFLLLPYTIWLLVGVMISYVRAAFIQSSTEN